MLKQVAENLVDVHGQHDAQYLLKPANQLAVIDEFGSRDENARPRRTKGDTKGEAFIGCLALREKFSEIFGQRQVLLAQQKELTASRTLRRQQLELYEFQAKEIDDAQLVAGEHQELQKRGAGCSRIWRRLNAPRGRGLRVRCMKMSAACLNASKA